MKVIILLLTMGYYDSTNKNHQGYLLKLIRYVVI
jgi:hypothetical protein